MLDEVDNKNKLTSYVNCVISGQSTDGRWINSDLYDGNNLVNDLILTAITLMILINYQNQLTMSKPKIIKIKNQQVDIVQNSLYQTPVIKRQEYGLTAFTPSNEIIRTYESFGLDVNQNNINKGDRKICNYRHAKNGLILFILLLSILFVYVIAK